jgi:hypothetical protein
MPMQVNVNRHESENSQVINILDKIRCVGKTSQLEKV